MSDPFITMKRVLDNVPIPAAKPIIVKIHCASCDRIIDPQEVQIITTSKLPQATDSLCSACRPMFQQHAKIVCLVCKQVTACVPKHKDKTGFEFKPGEYYHVDKCPTCAPGTITSKLLEKQEFDSKR